MHKLLEMSTTDQILEGYAESVLTTFPYANLVQKVSENLTLTNWISKREKDEPSIINLVKNDWISVLKVNPIIQEYLAGKVEFFKRDSKTNTALIMHYIPHNKKLRLLVLGSFRLDTGKFDKIIEKDEKKRLKLKQVDCAPLQCLSEIMLNTLRIQILPNAKFFFKGCNGSCPECRRYNVQNEDWCVKKNLVLEQNLLKATDRAYCESRFQDETKVLLDLQLDSAYSFGTNCKIGGFVRSMIFIDDLFDSTDEIHGILRRDENFMPDEPENPAKKIKLELENGDVIAVPSGFETPVVKKLEVIQSSVEPMP